MFPEEVEHEVSGGFHDDDDDDNAEMRRKRETNNELTTNLVMVTNHIIASLHSPFLSPTPSRDNGGCHG